jgi:hypothetical protein
MPIPQTQLETWAGQGSITQSAATYASIKNALEASTAVYDNRNFKIFLQGSYGNDTNIYSESDVDVVIRYDGAFFHDINKLPAEQQAAFHSTYSDGTYPYSKFRGHVRTALETAFGDSVKSGNKAIQIKGNGSRRKADVVVAFEFRRYYKFNGSNDEPHETGICFFTQDSNTRIVNFPKQHSENCVAKHAATNKNFKPLVRMFKNIRTKLVDDGIIGGRIAPSYFIEGLLYNVPSGSFTGTYSDIVLNILKWLHQTTDRTKFVCANEQYYLLRDNSPECWPCTNGTQFIDATIQLWNDW